MPTLTCSGDCGLRAGGIEVREDHVVEEVAAAGDGGEGRPDPAGAEDEDAHWTRAYPRAGRPRDVRRSHAAPTREFAVPA